MLKFAVALALSALLLESSARSLPAAPREDASVCAKSKGKKCMPKGAGGCKRHGDCCTGYCNTAAGGRSGNHRCE